MFVFDFGGVLGLISLALLAMQLFAFVDASLRPAPVFEASGKWSKSAWLIVLGLAVLASMLLGRLNLIGLLGLVASIVYIVDVRPAVRSLGGGRPGRGRSW